jgi:hypothetical protein
MGRACLIAACLTNLLLPAALCAQRAEQLPDLSGDWFHPALPSISPSDPRGNKRGHEGDIPYRAETLTAMMAEVATSGTDGNFGETTDPHNRYCEPLGLIRTFSNPGKLRFIQTAEAVYLLDESGPTFRVVWMNAPHPDDPDPQYLGHSIGHYENGDTLVVDTVGVNEKTWLDGVGHPHNDQLHLIERFRRVDDKTLSYEVIIDDPAAYTKTWTSGRNFTRSDTGFLRYQWVCSTRDTLGYADKMRTSTVK